jgi:hypothetical protein
MLHITSLNGMGAGHVEGWGGSTPRIPTGRIQREGWGGVDIIPIKDD